MNISQAAYAKMEKPGVSHRMTTLKKIAKEMDLDVEQLQSLIIN